MKDEDQVSLREFILVQLKAVEERFAHYARYANDRLERTEKDLERRLEGMNEFRAQLTKQASTFIARDYYDREHKDLIRRLELLENAQSDLTGRYAMMAGFIGLVLAIVSIAVHWWH